MTKGTVRVFAATCALVSATMTHVQGFVPLSHTDDFTGRPRVIVISDVGNEPDDQMSLVRFLIYSNEFDIEALIAAASTWQKNSPPLTSYRRIILTVHQSARYPG